MTITRSQWQTAVRIKSRHAFQEVVYILLAGSVGALLGEESDSPYRGSIIGVFGLLGSIGILATTFVGGQLFDAIGRTATFMAMGVMDILLIVAALYVRASRPQKNRNYRARARRLNK